jgi:hypothetical protein
VVSSPAKPTSYRVDPAPARPRATPRPLSARFESVELLRGFTPLISLRAPSRLACRTRTVWQYQHVPSLSGLLPTLPSISRIRLPSAPIESLRRLDGGVLSPPHGHKAPRGARLPRSAGMRHDRGGPLLYPGAAVSSRPAGHHRSAPAASQRPALHPRCRNPSAREVVTRHQQRFTRLTRPIFPLPVAPGRNGNPSAFPPGFAPRRYQRRTPRWEQVSRTLTQSYTFDISRTSQR